MPLTALAALVLFSATQGATLPPASPPTQKSPHVASLREMGGFLLGQYAKNIEAKLGKPTRTDTDKQDGETIWRYELAPGEATVFSVSISKDESPHVTSIDYRGKPMKGVEGPYGITLGMPKADVIRILGEPDTTEPRTGEGEPKGEILDWEDRNHYIEVDANGRVDRIQIVDNREGYPEKGETKPDLEGFRKVLEARDRAGMLDWLAADVDLYTKSDDTVNFVGSPREDLANEESLISRYLYGGTGSLRDLLTSSLVAGTELSPNPEDDTQIASVFPDDSPIEAIIWAYEAGRWRVWEVHYRDDETR